MQIQSFYILYSSFSIVFFIRAHGDANGTLDFYIAHYPNPGIISISSVPVLPSKIVKLKATPKTSVLHPKFSHGLIPQLQRSLYLFVTPPLDADLSSNSCESLRHTSTDAVQVQHHIGISIEHPIGISIEPCH